MQGFENTNLYAMLSMIDTKHGIIINENLGLLGNIEFPVDENYIHLFNYGEDRPIRRGDSFQVVDGDGCLLLDYYITETYILEDENNEIEAYIFNLRDFKAEDDILSIMYGISGKILDGLIAYDKSNKFYINNIKELANNYEIDSTLIKECVGVDNYIITYKNNKYTLSYTEEANKISIYKKRRG